MNLAKKIAQIAAKLIASLIILVLLAVAGTSFSAVYDFRKPSAFSGPDIYNPYAAIDTSYCWKRALFHCHTRVDGIMNECSYWPQEVYNALSEYGYDIVAFSNHNKLIEHPFDPALQINVYEHGYNLFKYHLLVFGTDKVIHYDNLLPMFDFQKQFQIEYLSKDSDFIQLNHPLRTTGITKRLMQRISGYNLIELDSGRSTENEYWDWALSSGHYCFGMSNDDLHEPDKSNRIAVRANFLCCKSSVYEDIKKTLTDGCFYSMRIPDYGRGDWDIKKEHNRNLPYIKDIGLEEDTIVLKLSEVADSIKVFGQNHSVLKKISYADSLAYMMKSTDPYARITAYFPEGEVIYTNPFARYDASMNESPFIEDSPDVDVLMTVLYNVAVLMIIFALGLMFYLILKPRRK